MDYIPVSPFMRPIGHDHLRPLPATTESVSKWELLRDLGAAQKRFGVTGRELGVLQGLLSFHPGEMLDPAKPLIVFPSNRSLAERLNGMAESTLRRHLSRLVAAGLVVRRDSPNGKRYATRGAGAFGFDLAALPARAREIRAAAEEARAATEALRRLRERISLMRRDLAALTDYGQQHLPGLTLWQDCAGLCLQAMAGLRRLSLSALTALASALESQLGQARDQLVPPEMSGNDSQNERHHLNSKEESCESEDRAEKPPAPPLALNMVIDACPTLQEFHVSPIRHWHQLFDAANKIRAGMGIGADLWDQARRQLGSEQAAVVLAAMLERFAEIRSPGAYLRSLVQKAAAGGFSCTPMILALLARRPQQLNRC